MNTRRADNRCHNPERKVWDPRARSKPISKLTGEWQRNKDRRLALKRARLWLRGLKDDYITVNW